MKVNKFVLILAFLMPFILAAQVKFSALPSQVPAKGGSIKILVGKNDNSAAKIDLDALIDTAKVGIYPNTVSGLVESGNSAVFRGKLVRETNGRLSYVDPMGLRITIDSIYGSGSSGAFASTSVFASTSASVGTILKTDGFYTAGDGGGATYKVVSTATADNKTTFALSGGNYAKLLPNLNGGINLLQVGAKLSDGVNDKAFIQAAIDSFSFIYCYNSGYFSVQSHFQIKSNLRLEFGNLTEFRTDGAVNDVFIVSNNSTIDSNVIIKGGVWNRMNGLNSFTSNVGNIYGKSAIHLYGLTFRKIKNLHLEGIKVINVPKFAVSVADFEDVFIKNIHFNTHSDGVHLMGAGKNVKIDGVYGYTGDDFVAVSGSDYPSNNDTKGDIEDISISNLHPTNSHGNAISLFPGNNGSRNLVFKNITIKDVKGNLVNANVIRIYSDGNGAETIGGVIKGISISNIFAKTIAGNYIFTSSIDTVLDLKLENIYPQIPNQATYFSSGYFNNVSIDNLVHKNTDYPSIWVSNLANIDKLNLYNIDITNNYGYESVLIDSSYQFRKLKMTISDSKFKSINANTGYISFFRDTSNYYLERVNFENTNCGILARGRNINIHTLDVDFSKSNYGVCETGSTSTVNIYPTKFTPTPLYHQSFKENFSGGGGRVYLQNAFAETDSTSVDKALPTSRPEGSIVDLRNNSSSPIIVYGEATVNGASSVTQPAKTTVRYRKISATNWIQENDLGQFAATSAWSRTGNAGTTAGTNFIGTTDAVDMIVKVNSTELGRFHNASGRLLLTGGLRLHGNIEMGFGTGGINTNNIMGYNTLLNNTTGNNNSAFGYLTMRYNTTGSSNAAFGNEALYNLTTGSNNMGIGSQALYELRTASGNVGIGGGGVLASVTTQGNNTGVGFAALQSTASANNVGIGSNAGATNTTGANNTYIGTNANAASNNLFNSSAIGYNSSVSASNQVVLGNSSVTQVIANGNLKVTAIPVYADQAAAASGGLVAGQFFQTSTGQLFVKN